MSRAVETPPPTAESKTDAEPTVIRLSDDISNTTTELSRTKENIIDTPSGQVKVRPYRSSSNAQLKAVLSFTPRVSSLDRHNVKSQSDEFRGFFVLFWIGMSLQTRDIVADDRAWIVIHPNFLEVMGGKQDTIELEIWETHHWRRISLGTRRWSHDDWTILLRTFCKRIDCEGI